MGAQDDTEQVLREIHVLFSKAQPAGSRNKVIVDKNEMLDLLKRLSDCMYAMLDENELTAASRDQADRRQQRKNADMIYEARKNAEDIYAASVLYADRTLSDVQQQIKTAAEAMNRVQKDLQDRLREEAQAVRDNQYELKGNLQDLIDTEKYLRLIEDENARIAREKEASPDHAEPSDASGKAAGAPEIRINADYFRARGLEDQLPEEMRTPQETMPAPGKDESGISPDDLDAEYFSWKDSGEKTESSRKDDGKWNLPFFGRKKS